MVDLNILKIAGAFVAGLAGIIGILGQTRTQDNKLTRSGKWLFGMAIVGVMLAVSTQIWEWRKSLEDDRIARLKNQELLVKLDTEAQLAANSLHEVKRAVTRFQTISFMWQCTFDSSDKLFGPYISDLAKRMEDAISKPSFKQGDQGQGLVLYKYPGTYAGGIEADSPTMPDEGKYPVLRHYILDVVPLIWLFKTPISLENFRPIYLGGFTSQKGPRPPQPDLFLAFKPDKVHINFTLQNVEPKVPSITVIHTTNIDVSNFVDTSGAIVSLEDLGGCQGIIYLPIWRREFQEFWRTASRHQLSCKINNQSIAVWSDSPSDGGQASRLISTQTGPPSPQLIYSFTFPTPASAKGDQ